MRRTKADARHVAVREASSGLRRGLNALAADRLAIVNRADESLRDARAAPNRPVLSAVPSRFAA